MLFEEIDAVGGKGIESAINDREAAIRCLRAEIEISLDCLRNIATDCLSGEKSFELSDAVCIDLLIAEYKVLEFLLDCGE